MSASGSAWLTRCTSTASPKLAVTTRPSPKASPAQRSTSSGGARLEVGQRRRRWWPPRWSRAPTPFNHEFRQIRSRIGEVDRPGRPRLRRSTTHRASPTRCCSTSTVSTCWWSAPDRSPPRKVAGLHAAGAEVRVVAPTCVAGDADAPRRRPGAASSPAPLRRGDLDGARLVVTATGVADVDDAVAADATARGIWVNAADRPSACSFILPAVARNGPLTVAVGTDGASPALARRLRDVAGAMLDRRRGRAGRPARRRSVPRCAPRADRPRTSTGAPQIDAVVPPAPEAPVTARRHARHAPLG